MASPDVAFCVDRRVSLYRIVARCGIIFYFLGVSWVSVLQSASLKTPGVVIDDIRD
jgi:hypothetical protein